jgi:hypothetical protein
VVTEPHVFRSWRWFAPHSLPAPLFPATGHILTGASDRNWYYAVRDAGAA